MPFGRKRSRYTRYEITAPVALGVQPAREQARPAGGASRLVAAAMLVAGVWLLYLFGTQDAFFISEVEVRGNQRVTVEEIVAASGLRDLNIFWADPREVATRVREALPDLTEVRVRCGLPARCRITVVERPPLLVWRQGEARIWIGADGVAVPARGERPGMMVVESPGGTLRPGERLDPRIVETALQLHDLLPPGTVVQYTARYGFTFVDRRGWVVRLGVGEDMALKLTVLEALAQELTAQGVRPAFVDLRYLEAPYYAVEQ
ncbi:MAG: FtsQ-type POTRA domain-containing protein [Chloroflexi bacterium]|nr:MAG: FtsQ-type POTRA domain-containing protein [Chloroflexota bacterium]